LLERLRFASKERPAGPRALFVVTAGEGIRDRAEKAKNEANYFKSHGLQALAIETAKRALNGCTGAYVRIGDFPTRRK